MQLKIKMHAPAACFLVFRRGFLVRCNVCRKGVRRNPTNPPGYGPEPNEILDFEQTHSTKMAAVRNIIMLKL